MFEKIYEFFASLIVTIIIFFKELFTGKKECNPRQTTTLTDFGYHNRVRGWFDVNNTGCKNDYCRVVGDNGGYLACAIAGETEQYNTGANVLALEEKLKNKLPVNYEFADPRIPNLPNYTFYRGQDVKGNDIANLPFVDAMAVCNSDPKCKGVNTSGWYKNNVDSIVEEPGWQTTDNLMMNGLFVKNLPKLA